jgi:iron(III) transport system permease protein
MGPSAVARDLAAPVARRHTGRQARWAWPACLLAILGVLVVYPLAMLLVGAFTNINPTVGGWGLDAFTTENFRDVLVNANVHRAVANSFIASLGGAMLAVAIGLFFAWVVARTDTPLKGMIEIAGMLPLFVPPLVAAFAWSLLGSPNTGIINVLLGESPLGWRVNFYSLSGIVFVFGVYYAPYVYMFTAASLKQMDPALEEASAIAGVGPFGTMLRVTLPLIAPSILSGGLLAFVVMLGIYGIPAILATPAKEAFLTTYIFTLVSWSPPLYNKAAAVSIVLIAVTALCVYVQHRLLAGRSFVTVAGKSFKPRQLKLGPWRYVTLAFALIYLFVVVVAPSAALLIAALRKFLFIPTVASLFDFSQYSLVHFHNLFANPLTMRSIVNGLKVGLAAALAGGALSFAIGYTIHRSRTPGRGLIDYLSTIPIAVPGLVIGVAYLWAWVHLPGGLFGTIWILALAFVARFLPDTVKALSSSLMQVHRELEEASVICGRGLLSTIRRIVLPLVLPGVLSGMVLLFVLSIRELGSSLFLYTSDSIIMSVLLLDFFEGGNIGVTAAFSVFQSVLLLVIIGTAHHFTRTTTDLARSG